MQALALALALAMSGGEGPGSRRQRDSGRPFAAREGPDSGVGESGRTRGIWVNRETVEKDDAAKSSIEHSRVSAVPIELDSKLQQYDRDVKERERCKEREPESDSEGTLGVVRLEEASLQSL